MNCQQARLLIDAYADGELGASEIVEIERHFQQCPGCDLAWRNLRGLRSAIKQDALFFAAPTELRQRVKAGLRSAVEPASLWRPRIWNWLTGATGACLAAALAMALILPSERQRLSREIVSSHIRSLMAEHLVDVASGDQHAVKPWFNGKLDFSPPVKDLKPRGFPLVGGRLDYLGGRSVSALVFQRQKHIINLFIWPATEKESSPAALVAEKGYSAIHWSDGGMAFWAVSDLNQKELMEFARDYDAMALRLDP